MEKRTLGRKVKENYYAQYLCFKDKETRIQRDLSFSQDHTANTDRSEIQNQVCL